MILSSACRCPRMGLCTSNGSKRRWGPLSQRLRQILGGSKPHSLSACDYTAYRAAMLAPLCFRNGHSLYMRPLRSLILAPVLCSGREETPQRAMCATQLLAGFKIGS